MAEAEARTPALWAEAVEEDIFRLSAGAGPVLAYRSAMKFGYQQSQCSVIAFLLRICDGLFILVVAPKPELPASRVQARTSTLHVSFVPSLGRPVE
jgi:hypothetical protein